MTTATKPAARYYVARPNGTVQRTASLNGAKAYARRLYDLGAVAPLVVCAPDADTARARAARCYVGEITIRQAARA